MMRLIRVAAIERLTPSMVRVTFADRIPAEQRVTLRFPDHRSRTYAVRAPDPLQIDVAGPWARSAAPGQVLELVAVSSGPAVPRGADWLLLVGDETALPAIATIVAALPPGARAVAYLEVRDEDEEQPLPSAADLTVHWVHRWSYGSVLRSVQQGPLPPGTMTAWLAGEASLVHAVQRYLLDERGLHPDAVVAETYWARAALRLASAMRSR